MLTTHHCLEPRLRMSGASAPLLRLHGADRNNLTLPFTLPFKQPQNKYIITNTLSVYVQSLVSDTNVRFQTISENKRIIYKGE